MRKIEVYTDGACRGNPGVGGWGAIIYGPDGNQEYCGGATETTNNRMELTAAIEALDRLPSSTELILHTDSEYVRKGITEWMKNWKRNGWKTASKKPVKNVDLWQRLDLAANQHQIDWRWVKGHAGNVGNEKADQLANRGIDELR